jgi:hypothetical protein
VFARAGEMAGDIVSRTSLHDDHSGGKKKREGKGGRGEWRVEWGEGRELRAWKEGKTVEQGRGKRLTGEGGELPRGRRMGVKYRSGGRKMGEKEENGGWCRPTMGHASPPPISNVPFIDTSPFGDVWNFATSPNGDFFFFKKKKKKRSNA